MLMTAMPSGIVYLLEDVIFFHSRPLRCAFQAKALTSRSDDYDASGIAPSFEVLFWKLLVADGIVAELRSSFEWFWWWLSALRGEFLLLCLPACLRLYFHLIWVAQDVIWRMLSRPSSLADVLSPLFAGGCFAVVVVLVVDSGGCFAALVHWSGGCFATFKFGDLLQS
jgi:hypothetical protein